MAGDPEVNAMQAVATALEALEQGAQARVLEWAAKRYGIALPKAPGRIGEKSDDQSDREFDSFVDLFDKAGPKSDPERALVGGYWFQVGNATESFTGQQVNDALKDLGHGIGNITVAISSLQDRKPALVRQVSKSGRSKQARKTYKLTSNGIDVVERMISGGGAAQEENDR